MGQVFDRAPALTLTDGHAAVHQAVLGERLRLALDADLSVRVTGRRLASPALVWNVAIGQSTLATHHVRANLFYRGLALRRAPAIGDTLHTVTEVLALRQNTRRTTGLAVLRVTTVDQEGRAVLDFRRCAMLPLRDPDLRTGHADDLDGADPGPVLDPVLDPGIADGWRLDAFPAGPRPAPGTTLRVVGGDVVSGAPELARLTLNIARVHHDASAGDGRRLVYGGHTIGLALAQATRALPDLVTVPAWHSCDHTGPVHEGDTLTSTVEVLTVDPRPAGGALAHLRSLVEATGETGSRPVLDCHLTALLA